MHVPKKILLIDDQTLFREGLISFFSANTDFIVIGATGWIHEGTELALLHKPDIILMDFLFPDGAGLDAAALITQHLPDCKIVFLTVSENNENLFAALRIGAMGYMLKNITSADLLSNLRALERGEKAISRKMVSVVLDEFSRTGPTFELGLRKRLLEKLSPRELDVLHEVESDATNFQIAQRLFLSENTVKHHIHNILEKLNVNNRRQAVSFARQNAFEQQIYGAIDNKP
jgi:two-component system NarL family response regulator